MRKMICLVCLFMVGSVAATERKMFMRFPGHVPVDHAVQIVEKAAMGRKWTAKITGHNSLLLKLNHNDCKAVLVLTFSHSVVDYEDKTTCQEYYPGDSREAEWEKRPVSGRWISNIRNDANTYFSSYRAQDYSSIKSAPASSGSGKSGNNIEEKLIKLKSLYEKKLITESEYQAKRREILSEF